MTRGVLASGPTSAFLYLVARTARNRFVARARRLRTPRYALALAAGAFYFWFLFFREPQEAPLAGVVGGDWSLLAGSLVFAMLAANWWLFGGDRGALAFSPAELHFLFPAPVSRRALVHFKLLRAQSVILFNTVLWVGLLGRGHTELNAGLRAVAIWTLFSTLHLHRLGAALTRASAIEHGRVGARRGALPFAAFAILFVVLAWSLMRQAPALRLAWSDGLVPFLGTAADALRAPVPSAVLAPFRALLAPGLAVTAAEWGRAMGPALAIMLAHYAWVVRTDAAFEEAALEASVHRAERLAAIRDGKPTALPEGRVRRTLVPLAPTGHPAVAIVWKNLIAATRTVRPELLVVPLFAATAALLIVALARPGGTALTQFAGVLFLSWSGLLVAAGPLWVRYDLRHDLPKIELLRAFPLPGWAVVLAEIAVSTILLTALQLALLTLAFAAYLSDATVGWSVGQRAALLAAAAVALPAVNALAFVVQNAAALLYPAWVRLGATKPGGVEAMGQGMITMLASLLGVGVLLLLPAAAGAAAGYVLRPALGDLALAPALVVGLLVTVLQLVPLLRWLGRVFDRTDPSAVSPS